MLISGRPPRPPPPNNYGVNSGGTRFRMINLLVKISIDANQLSIDVSFKSVHKIRISKDFNSFDFKSSYFYFKV